MPVTADEMKYRPSTELAACVIYPHILIFAYISLDERVGISILPIPYNTRLSSGDLGSYSNSAILPGPVRLGCSFRLSATYRK